MKFSKWVVVFLLGLSLSAQAESDFTYGAIRQVSSKDYKNDYTFLLLPTASTTGKKFGFYNYKLNKISCCVSIVEGPFDDDTLKKKYNIPAVWRSDLTDAGGGHDVAGAYEPIVYLGTVDKTIPTTKDNALDFDGFLVDENAQLGSEKRTLIFANRIYRVKKKEWKMATDAGALYEYTLTDISNSKPTEKSRKVVVHYGVN